MGDGAPGVRVSHFRALWCFFFGGIGHQSTYLGVGGMGAGPRTVNHLRYNVFHVPSRRMRSSVPLTNRTSPVFCRLIPTPYGSSLRLGPTMWRYGSCDTSPARIESSVLTASTWRCCNATRQSAQ